MYFLDLLLADLEHVGAAQEAGKLGGRVKVVGDRARALVLGAQVSSPVGEGQFVEVHNYQDFLLVKRYTERREAAETPETAGHVGVEPPVGIEPTTCSLRVSRSAD